MTPYAEAIEQQLATLRFMASPAGVELVRSRVSHQIGSELDFSDVHARLERTWGRRLALGTPFWVDADIVRLLVMASEALPWNTDQAIERTTFVVPHGWVWLARPADLPDELLRENGYEPHTSYPLHAFAWSCEATMAIYDFLTMMHGPDGRRVAFPTETGIYPYAGESLPGVGRTSDGFRSRHLVRTARFAFAFLLFVQQRLLTSRSVPVDRAARHRIHRLSPGHEPVVRVVELRRRATEPRPAHEHEAVEWSCRWLVRGHWRQQACGSGLADHRPTWVTAHVKGPESKPLRPPRATVFAVVR